MNADRRPLAVVALAWLFAGCSGGGGTASPEQVAVDWLGARSVYDGGAAWDLEAPGFRAGRTRDQAVDEGDRQQARECPNPNEAGCLLPEGIEYEATGRREEGRCVRVLVRSQGADGTASEGAVAVIRVDGQWRVRHWLAARPDDDLEGGAARDCGA